jgi:putative phosphoribosyl transferase
VILALPRGGVPVAVEVAAALEAPLDLVLVRKIGLPARRELAMGAVVDGAHPIVVRNEDVIRRAGIGEAEFKTVCDRELAEMERRRERYLGNPPRVEVAGRTVIIIDDGVATGATIRAALRAIRMQRPGRLVLAVHGCADRCACRPAAGADHVVCLEDHDVFVAIGLYYAEFRQTTDLSTPWRAFPPRAGTGEGSSRPEKAGHRFRSLGSRAPPPHGEADARVLPVSIVRFAQGIAEGS